MEVQGKGGEAPLGGRDGLQRREEPCPDLRALLSRRAPAVHRGPGCTQSEVIRAI